MKPNQEQILISAAIEEEEDLISHRRTGIFSYLFCSCFTFKKKKRLISPEKRWMIKASMPMSEKRILLPPLLPEDEGKKCLVLDLDETLIHSSFRETLHSDFIVPVEMDEEMHNVYVSKRPGVDEFLEKLGSQFEIVVFTASLAKYADPVIDLLDVNRVIKHRLFREGCVNHRGNYIKDLEMLGRPLNTTIIIDNSPTSYALQPQNAIPISSWFSDPNDTELVELIPFLERLKYVDDVTLVLGHEE